MLPFLVSLDDRDGSWYSELQAGDIETDQLAPQLGRCGDDKSLHLIHSLCAGLMAESLMILSIRIISTLSRPDLG